MVTPLNEQNILLFSFNHHPQSAAISVLHSFQVKIAYFRAKNVKSNGKSAEIA